MSIRKNENIKLLLLFDVPVFHYDSDHFFKLFLLCSHDLLFLCLLSFTVEWVGPDPIRVNMRLLRASAHGLGALELH